MVSITRLKLKKDGKTSELWYEQGVEDRVPNSELKVLKKIFFGSVLHQTGKAYSHGNSSLVKWGRHGCAVHLMDMFR